MSPTEFDRAKQDFYKNCPDLIVRIGNWESAYFCANCSGEINKSMGCMKTYRKGWSLDMPIPQKYGRGVENYSTSIIEISCPHCLIHSKFRPWQNYNTVAESKPIPFKLIRRRKIYTKIPSWWSKLWGTKDEYFWEYSEELNMGKKDEAN